MSLSIFKNVHVMPENDGELDKHLVASFAIYIAYDTAKALGAIQAPLLSASVASHHGRMQTSSLSKSVSSVHRAYSEGPGQLCKSHSLPELDSPPNPPLPRSSNTPHRDHLAPTRCPASALSTLHRSGSLALPTLSASSCSEYLAASHTSTCTSSPRSLAVWAAAPDAEE